MTYIAGVAFHHVQTTRLESLTVVVVKTIRGVQYVHWVMHKCIMVKAGGKYT